VRFGAVHAGTAGRHVKITNVRVGSHHETIGFGIARAGTPRWKDGFGHVRMVAAE
jgi:hypothetical protein